MRKIKTAVILAAGMGTRLRDITNDDIPKGGFSINGKSLVDRSIEKLRSLGIEKIYIVTGHLSDFYDEIAMKNQFIETRKNRRYKATGSMTSLAILENDLKEDFLLLESDLIYEIYGIIRTMDFPMEDCVLLSGKTNAGDECYVEVKDGNLHGISKNIDDLDSVYGELVGISKVSLRLYKDMLKKYKELIADENDRFYFNELEGRKLKKYDYEDILFEVAKKREVGYLKIENLVWGEIDDANHLKRIKEKVLPRLEKVSV